MEGKRTVVVGSGAGGLTLALLLAKIGCRVTLVEKQPDIGGYLRQFTRQGIRFDTGFHFSGGFRGIMTRMLEVLGIADRIHPMPISNRIVLNAGEQELILPGGCGHHGAQQILQDHFPGESAALGTLFNAVREIWTGRQTDELLDLPPAELNLSRFDLMTVREYCDRLGLSRAAETAAGSFATCHGTPLSEAPMSFHAQVGYSLYDDLSRPKGGGGSLLAAFLEELKKYHVEFRTGTEPMPMAEPDANGECREIRLTDGTILPADQVFFTIHPRAVAALLPEKVKSPVFLRRLNRLRETTSFFCAYFLVEDGTEIPTGLLSFHSGNDLDHILRGQGYSTGCLISREPDPAGRLRTTATAFRTMPCGEPSIVKPHRERLHDAEYQEFKARISEEIRRDLTICYPQLKGRLTLVESGTPLTCLDYDPPTGSAYGVRNICGQARLCGKLPLNNGYIAGQSALVPGVMGTMLTSFTIFRLAAGETLYRRVLENV